MNNNQGAHPLDLRRPSNWHAQQTTPKKHRQQSSIARGLKSLIPTNEPHSPSYQHLLSPSPSMSSTTTLNSQDGSSFTVPHGPSRTGSSESWDVVDDLPLRWATDFVPLASPGSRLVNSSILSYALWKDDNRKGRGGQLLAITTKSNILLYETPKGERAFRFVKVSS